MHLAPAQARDNRFALATPPLLSAYRQRAELALQSGEPEQALVDARKALDLARTLQGGNARSALTGLAWLTLGRVLRDTGEAAGSRDAVSAAHTELLNTLGADHPDAQRAQRLLSEY